MKIDEVRISENAIKFLKTQGYDELYPPQEEAIKAGLLDGENLLVSAPTASGKTLIAVLAMINFLSKKEGKIVYLSPLRALASEKFFEFKKLNSIDFKRKLRIQISTGDFEGIDNNLEKADVMVMTNEKMDSLMRHSPDWIDEIGLVISDEIHLIGDEDRGPALEMTLTNFLLLEKKPQILALSATISNSNELSEWLGCKLVENKWRPVPLYEGVYDGGFVVMNDGREFEVESSIRGKPVDLGIESVSEGGQSLVFAETRARSSSLATKAAGAISKFLKEPEKEELEKISKKLLENNEHTELIKTLATLVKSGVAFHHAGLNPYCRQTIESEFRNGRIKLLTATPTLAAGVNLPARRVVISSINRYNSRLGGNKPISVLEYKQLCGRAGRPQYDKFGESIIVGQHNGNSLIEYYVKGEPEPIYSKITDDKSLRIHVLSLISTKPGIKQNQIVDFFLHSLGGIQTNKPSIKFGIDIAIRFLKKEGLILHKGERFVATDFGKRVSRLYLDPLTAVNYRDSLYKVSKQKNHTLGFLHLITNSEEFFPKFSLRNKDFELISLLIENKANELIDPISEYECSRSLLALEGWINERTEIWLSDTLNIQSGDMHRIVETSDWLIYCLRELAKQQERGDLLEELDILRRRIVYGIKEELNELVKIKGIGRIRARKLFKNGIRNIEDLTKIPAKKLAEIDKIGSTLANNIKSQLRKAR